MKKNKENEELISTEIIWFFLVVSIMVLYRPFFDSFFQNALIPFVSCISFKFLIWYIKEWLFIISNMPVFDKPLNNEDLYRMV